MCQQEFPADVAHFYKGPKRKDGTVYLSSYCIPCERQRSYDNRKIRQAKARELKRQVREMLQAQKFAEMERLKEEKASAKRLKDEINRAHRLAITEDKLRTAEAERLAIREMKRMHSEALRMNATFDRLVIKELKKEATKERERAQRATPEYKEKARLYRLKYRANMTPEERASRNEASRIYRNENREYFKRKSTEWNKKNPEAAVRAVLRRRAKKRGNGYEVYTTQQVIEMYGTDCHICSEPIDLSLPRKIGAPGWKHSLQVDHVVPISKGGPDILDNVRPSHAFCNMTKRDKTTEEASAWLYLNNTTP